VQELCQLGIRRFLPRVRLRTPKTTGIVVFRRPGSTKCGEASFPSVASFGWACRARRQLEVVDVDANRRLDSAGKLRGKITEPKL